MTFTIGVDVGGTKVLGGVVDEFGEVHKTARRDTPKEGGAALTAAIAEVANELKAQFPVESVGVSAAGWVSSDRKTMLATPNISGWNGANLHQELTGLIGLPEFAALARAAVLLPVLCHETQSLTTMPMERAAPAIMAIALSIESQFRSGIFTVASFSSCAFVIVPTFTLFG